MNNAEQEKNMVEANFFSLTCVLVVYRVGGCDHYAPIKMPCSFPEMNIELQRSRIREACTCQHIHTCLFCPLLLG